MINLIPKPQHVKVNTGVLEIGENESIYSEINLPLINLSADEDSSIIRIYKDSALSDEEYTLNVCENGIIIKALGESGAYYALQSLRMLGRFDEGESKVPFVEISDKPCFRWRGINFDESRHFFGKEYIKKVLDDMFRLKLNILHWHLTDDSGWRIEIKKYPLLTQIGSKRAYTQIGGWGCCETDGTPCEGFYTQNDIKEIVEYAKKRCISIVPEIDVPAHFAAALAAYPDIACRNLKRDVQGYFGKTIPNSMGIKDWNRPVCMGKQKSIQFIFDIYDEVCSLFPFEYFHIGGDECDVSEWKRCPDCRRVMKENSFKNVRELQLMLTNRLFAFLKSKGKHMIGWNEILRKGEIDKSVVVQYWELKKDKRVKKHINSGGKIIISKHQYFYFDYPYSMRSLKKTYEFTADGFGVNKDNKKNVLGIEGEFWTEWIHSEEKFEFLAHPRLEVLSEVAWTDAGLRNFNEFIARYNSYKSVYKHLGINYAVNKIFMPKSYFTRAKIAKLFHNGDPDYEFKLNKKYYSEGEQ